MRIDLRLCFWRGVGTAVERRSRLPPFFSRGSDLWCGDGDGHFLRRCHLLLADRRHEPLAAVAATCRAASAEQAAVIRTAACDVTDKAQVVDAVAAADAVAASASSPTAAATILVNCAGITRDARLSDLSETAWDDVLDVNLKGTFLACQAFCRPARLASLLGGSGGADAGGGSIVNIGSIVSEYGNIGQANYAASKGGVVGLTRSLAKEMAALSRKEGGAARGDGGAGGHEERERAPPVVRVNCIQPGDSRTRSSRNASGAALATFL